MLFVDIQKLFQNSRGCYRINLSAVENKLRMLRNELRERRHSTGVNNARIRVELKEKIHALEIMQKMYRQNRISVKNLNKGK